MFKKTTQLFQPLLKKYPLNSTLITFVRPKFVLDSLKSTFIPLKCRNYFQQSFSFSYLNHQSFEFHKTKSCSNMKIHMAFKFSAHLCLPHFGLCRYSTINTLQGSNEQSNFSEEEIEEMIQILSDEKDRRINISDQLKECWQIMTDRDLSVYWNKSKLQYPFDDVEYARGCLIESQESQSSWVPDSQTSYYSYLSQVI